MHCPVLKGRERQLAGIREHDPTQCINQDCAWWNFTNESCAISVLASSLQALADNLVRILDKARAARE